MTARPSTVAAPGLALPLSRPSAAIGAQPSPAQPPGNGEGLTTDETGTSSSLLESRSPIVTSGAAAPSQAAPLNLHQRLAAIASEVKIQATGTTGRQAGNQRAISIGDVDDALGPLFVKHGVVSDYESKDEPKSFKIPTTSGEMTMWLVGIQAHIYNVDTPSDALDRVLHDIGSNPSAAVSFALKRWYRALFKLVEDDDQPESHDGVATARPNPQGKMSTAQQARIIRLNADLPKPKAPPVIDALLRDLPYDKALAQMTMDHERQCGLGDGQGCGHVKGEAT